MATLAHEVTWYIAREWEKMYASAVLSGIVGDLAHQAGGGYHISIENNRSTNYSVTRPDDKAPPGAWPRNLAAAIDMSMNPSDMKLCSSRLWNVWNDKTDPRRQYLNGFNGWFNDGGPAKRYDFVTQGISTTTSDHKWHVHNEIRRKWVTSMIAALAILSALRGETKEQYLAGATGDDDMFCKKGDKGDKVLDLQIALVDHGIWVGPPDATDRSQPYNYCDKDYGGWTTRALKEFIGDSNNTGENFGPWEHRFMVKADSKKFGGGGQKGDAGKDGKTPTKVELDFTGVKVPANVTEYQS